MSVEKNLKLLPNRASMCFGCSPDNPAGLHLQFYTDGEAIFSWIIVPDHLCGWENLVHGGIISTILDEIMGRSIIYKLRCLVMTKSITVDFLKPILINKELNAVGRILEIKGDREVLTEGTIINERGELCAKAGGIYTSFNPDDSKKLGIEDNDVVKWINRLPKE